MSVEISNTLVVSLSNHARLARRSPWRVISTLTLAAVAIFYLSLTSGTWLITPDSTDYVEGARSLARFEGFVDAAGVPQTIVQPGAAAVYAPAAAVPSGDYFYFNLLTKLLTIAFLVLAYLVARRSAGEGVACLIVLFLALSERLIFESTRILSDIPFSAAFMLTLWAFPQDKLDALTARAALVLGGLVALCYAMRMAGVFVYAGYCLYIALWARRNRLRTIVLMSSVLVLAAGALWLRAHGDGATPSYLQLMFLRRSWVMDSGFPGLADWYERIASNSAVTLRTIYVAFSNDRRLLPGGVVICLLIGVGFATALSSRRGSLHACFLVCYLPLLVLTPFPPEPRYVLPVLPSLALIAASGARLLTGRLANDRQRLLAAGALIAVVAVNPYWTRGVASAAAMRGELKRAVGVPVLYRGHQRFIELIERHRGSLTAQDAVTTMHANIVKYFLPPQTRVSGHTLTEDVDKLYRALLNGGTTTLYCDKTVENWRYLEPVIRAHPASFELQAENGDAVIYRIRR